MTATQPMLLYTCHSSGWIRSEILANDFFISFEPTDQDLIILVLNIFFSKEPQHRYFGPTKSCRLDFPPVQQQPQIQPQHKALVGPEKNCYCQDS
jgi:hypothetical protein